MTEPGADASLATALAEERAIMDEYASGYRRWTLTGGLVYEIERAEFVRWALGELRKDGREPSGLRYLDVGCGTGELLEELARAGCDRLTGFDLSEPMLVEARRSVPQATLVAGALETQSFAPQSFDVVVAAFTVHHLVDPRTFFRVADRVLGPGGRIFLLEYNASGASHGGWTRLAVRLAVAPVRFVMRWKNRALIAAQPDLIGKFNSAHRLMNLEELAGAARSEGFAPAVVTRGLLGPWFLHDSFGSSRVDRALLGILARIDRACPPRARWFQWMAGRRVRHRDS